MIKEFLYDLLYPKRCIGCKKFGSFVCSNCFATIHFNDSFICPICLKSSINGLTHPGCQTPQALDGLFSAVVYKGIIKKMIYQFKYAPYLTGLVDLIGNLSYEGLIQNESFMRVVSSENVLVPVPLHKSRQTKRGYNHAELIAKQIEKHFGLKERNILLRIKDTKPQFRLSKEERRKNILGAFVINEKYKKAVQGKTIFLVDDIATTCSTLKECGKVLKKSGAKKVYGLTFAKEY